jgi:hypothetical protein
MQFKVTSITKSIEIWDHQPRKNWGQFQLLFEIEPLEPWVMELGDDEILCSDSHEESNSSRERVKSYLTLLNRETITEAEENQIGNSIGAAYYINGLVNFYIYLTDTYFQNLMKELSSNQNVTVFILIESRDKNGKEIITTDFSDFHNTHWENPSDNKNLKIEHFKLKITLND